MGEQAKAKTDLVADLGLYTAVMVVIGSVIGSGIFKKPAAMAAQLGSGTMLVGTWIGAGLMTLIGALTNAEIASMISATGGQYVFFRRIYNNFIGYLYGWAVFSVIQTGSIASISYVFSQYCGYFLPLPRLSPAWEQITFSLGSAIQFTPFANIGEKLLTVICIMFLTFLNIRGVSLGAMVQNIFTTFKIAAIAAVIGLAFILGHSVEPSTVTSTPIPTPIGWYGWISAFTLAITGAFWAYDGWNNITYIASEVRHPQRNIPRALFLGTLAIITIYVLTNLAYLHVLPLEEMATSNLVAADVMRKLLGPIGGALISLLVIISTFGTANGTILASARVYYAMAHDGLFFSSVGNIHPRYRTPARSLLVQGLWSSLLVFSGTFDQLTDMLIFVSWLFYALGAAGVFILRRRLPNEPRPYRVIGYPLVPALFVLFSASFVVISIKENMRNALVGLLLVAIGIPFYFLWQRRNVAGREGI